MTTTYVKFVDASGIIEGGGTDGWTPVRSSDFDTTLAADLAAARADGDKSVSLAVPVADSGVADEVRAASALGSDFAVQIATYDSSGRLTSDYDLPGATVSDDAVQGADAVITQTFALQATAYTSTVTTYDSSGNATSTNQGYNFATGTPRNVAAPSAPGSPTTLATSAAADAATPRGLPEYVYVQAGSGTPSASGYAGADAENVGGYAYVLTNTPGSFGPVESAVVGLTLHTDASSLTLLKALATGHPVGAELAAIQNDNTLLSETTLSDLVVSSETFALDVLSNDREFQLRSADGGTVTTEHTNTAGQQTSTSSALGAVPAGAASAPVPAADEITTEYQVVFGSGSGEVTSAFESASFTLAAGSGLSPLSLSFDGAPSADVVAAMQGDGQTVSFKILEDKIVSGALVTYDTLSFASDPANPVPTIGTDDLGHTTYTYTFDIQGFGEQYMPPGETPPQYPPLIRYDLATNSPCYCPGTLITTGSGEQPVETLVVGDLLVTASGERRGVKWIGRRSYCGRFLAANPAVQPIRFRAGCLGAGLPQRDLLISPEHAMFLGGLLIPARCLVNGTSIVRERGLTRVDYVHVELDSHDVILAEGAPSETFLDDDSRGLFENASEYAALYPAASERDGYCAPRVEQGQQLEAIRRRLAAVTMDLATAA